MITNDDGIHADGLARLAKAAKEYGEVWVVAPEGQRSAASHSITLHSHIDVFPAEFSVEGVSAFYCSGTPADCVRVGGLSIMEKAPDVVLSGINHGYNVASDIQYSATVGAAFEASFQGYHAIAFSEGFGDCHEVSDYYLNEILEELLRKPLAQGEVWNVNFPDCTMAECSGILQDRRVSQGMFYRDRYRLMERLKDGGTRWMVEGQYNEDAEPETDFFAIVNRFVSIGRINNLGYC